jgi:hypothetical protein
VNLKKQESNFPPFPSQVIKGFAKDFVNLYQGKREVPDELLWAAFATYFGSLISPYARLAAFDASEPRLYTAIIGRSGKTKKSTAQNFARDFIWKLQDGSEDHIRIVEGFGSSEGLVTQLQALPGKMPAILHLDEINVLAQKTGMDGSVGISLLNKLFEDHHYEQPIRDKNPRITNAHLSMVGASTLEDYQKAWSGKHKDTGFLSRIMVIPAEPSSLRIALPKQPDLESYRALQTRVKTFYNAIKVNPKEFEINSDALELWQAFYETFEDGEEWNRIDAYAYRFMTLQAALTDQNSITKEIMKDVIDISKYEVESRVHVSPVIAENQLAMVEQIIRKHFQFGETITRRDLRRRINAERYGIKNFHAALKNLTDAEELQSEQRGKTILYTRVPESDESSEVDSSPVIISHDDRRTAQNAL